MIPGPLTAGKPVSPRRADVLLSVVIVSWNTRDLLERCLFSLERAAPGGLLHGLPGSVEVLVVDNASSDHSGQMVQNRFPSIGLLQNTENLGFARACNQGIRASSGRYVLLLNPDTELEPDSLSELVSYIDGHPAVGAAGARLVNSDGSHQVSCFPHPTLRREVWRLLHLDSLAPRAQYPCSAWRIDRPFPVDTAQGACLILRSETLAETGLLDESYFIYTEEVDLCYRIRKRGWEIYWVPQARVVHMGGESTRQIAGSMFLQLYRSKVHFFRKHRGGHAVTCYKLVLLLAAVLRVLISPLALMESQPRRGIHLRLALRYCSLIKALPTF